MRTFPTEKWARSVRFVDDDGNDTALSTVRYRTHHIERNDHYDVAPAEGPERENGRPPLAEVYDPTHVVLRLECRLRPRLPYFDGASAA